MQKTIQGHNEINMIWQLFIFTVLTMIVECRLPSSAEWGQKIFCTDHHLFSTLRDGKHLPGTALNLKQAVEF